MLSDLKCFIQDDSGATALEYVLVASLIFLGIIAGVTTIGTKTANSFAHVGSNLQ